MYYAIARVMKNTYQEAFLHGLVMKGKCVLFGILCFGLGLLRLPPVFILCVPFNGIL